MQQFKIFFIWRKCFANMHAIASIMFYHYLCSWSMFIKRLVLCWWLLNSLLCGEHSCVSGSAAISHVEMCSKSNNAHHASLCIHLMSQNRTKHVTQLTFSPPEFSATSVKFPWAVCGAWWPHGIGHRHPWGEYPAGPEDSWGHNHRPRWRDLHVSHLWRGNCFNGDSLVRVNPIQWDEC